MCIVPCSVLLDLLLIYCKEAAISELKAVRPLTSLKDSSSI